MSVVFQRRYEPQASAYQGDAWRYSIEGWTLNGPDWLDSSAEWIAEQAVRAEVALEGDTLLEVTIEDLGIADIPIVGGLARKLKVGWVTHASPVTPALISAVSSALIAVGIVILAFKVDGETWNKLGRGVGSVLSNLPLILAGAAVLIFLSRE